MGQGFFITATGTDLGKTYISALICKELKNKGFKAGYYKAAISGAEDLYNSDASYVALRAGLDLHNDVKVSYLFKEPLSPHLAARHEQVTIDREIIKCDYHNILLKKDYVLVEGSGGIVCPLSLEDGDRFMLYDMVGMLKLPSFIVADAGLGTINATITTIDFMHSRDLKVAGVILNNFDPSDAMHLDNLRSIELLSSCEVVATVQKNGERLQYTHEFLTDFI